MSEPIPYLSEAWLQEAQKRLTDQLTRDDMNHAGMSMVNVFRNCSGGGEKYVFYSFSDGALENLRSGSGDVPEADLCVTADYDVFVKIAKNELSGQTAMMKGLLKLKGNMAKVMKFAPLSDKVTKVLAGIPTEY